METSLRLEVCDHVEKMIDQMKATDLDTGEQGERFIVDMYMYVTGSDDNGNDTVEEGSSTDTASEEVEFFWINCIVWNGQMFSNVCNKDKKERNKKKKKKKKKKTEQKRNENPIMIIIIIIIIIIPNINVLK